ncbi:MAG: alcohol acetyltransferase, partial [Christensenella sp.]
MTVSAYIAALLIACTAEEQGLEYKKDKRPIIISVPIDLRGMFPSHTLRNFISLANVGMVIDGEIDFDKILEEVSA